MTYKGVAVFIIGERAYLPCFGIYPSGIITHIFPVYTSNLNETELILNIEKVLKTGVKPLADVSAEEWKSQKKPMLVATGVRSWSELDKKSIGYGLEWVDQNIVLTFSKLNKENRQEIDTSKTLIFTNNTSLEVIVRLMINDIKSH